MKEEFKILKTNQLPDSEIEIEGEISVEAVARHRVEAIKRLNERLTIDGFRKGHIPEKVLIEKVGDLGILEEAASLALENFYLKILIEVKINPVGRPQVSITKLAAGNPLGFKIKVAMVPEVKLPDYKKLAKAIMGKDEKAEVTDQEFEEALLRFQKNLSPEKAAAENAVPPPLTPLTNELVKQFGEFKDVEDFKNQLRENLRNEKELRLREKRRLETIEKIIAATSVVVPKILVESEQEKMLTQFKSNVSGMGIKIEDYFKQIGKTEEEIKGEWKNEAEKRAKMELILQKIALLEKIEPAKEDVEKETKHLLSHHKDADPSRVRIYIEQLLTNELVWRFLEEKK